MEEKIIGKCLTILTEEAFYKVHKYNLRKQRRFLNIYWPIAGFTGIISGLFYHFNNDLFHMSVLGTISLTLSFVFLLISFRVSGSKIRAFAALHLKQFPNKVTRVTFYETYLQANVKSEHVTSDYHIKYSQITSVLKVDDTIGYFQAFGLVFIFEIDDLDGLSLNDLLQKVHFYK